VDSTSGTTLIPDDDILEGGQHPITYFRYVFAQEELRTYAGIVASDVGYDEFRALSSSELVELTRAADASGLSRDDLGRFRRMDLALEVTAEDGDIRYVAVEIAFYAEQRGIDRAIANAQLLERFTNRPAYAAIAVGRDYRNLPEAALAGHYPVRIETTSGARVYLHQLNERNIERAMAERRYERRLYAD